MKGIKKISSSLMGHLLLNIISSILCINSERGSKNTLPCIKSFSMY
jgi:hypothetical protein